MFRWIVALGALLIIPAVVVSPRFGFIGVFAVLFGLALAFWLLTIVDLLHVGPQADRTWWLAALVIVVVLGPLGALAYRLAAPSFASPNDRLLNRP